MIPCPFAKLVFAPKAFSQFDLRLGILWHQDSYDVISVFDVPNSEDSPVDFCGSRYLSLFSGVDRGNYRCKLIRTTCLYLNKTQSFAIQGDDIDLASNLNAFAIAADWDFEICDYYSVALPDQMINGQSFAAIAEARYGFR